MNGQSSQFSLNRFANERTASADGTLFETFHAAFLDFSVRREESQNSIRTATGATLDDVDPLQYLENLHMLYNRATINDETRNEFHRVAVSNTALPEKFTLCHGASHYEKLKKSVRDCF